MEQITVYKDSYLALLEREFELITKLAQVKGRLEFIATMGDDPEFIVAKIEEIVENL